jgi:hypothetical protein
VIVSVGCGNAGVGGEVVDDFADAALEDGLGEGGSGAEGERQGGGRREKGVGGVWGVGCGVWREGGGDLELAGVLVGEEDDAVCGGDEALCLVEGGLADGGGVEEGGELLGELFDEVDFAIEVEDFGGEGAGFVLACGELGEEEGEGAGWDGGAGDVAEGEAVELDGDAGGGGVGGWFAEEDFAGGVLDAGVGAEGFAEGGDGGVVC